MPSGGFEGRWFQSGCAKAGDWRWAICVCINDLGLEGDAEKIAYARDEGFTEAEIAFLRKQLRRLRDRDKAALDWEEQP